jgi:tetratricopeptide (TPR) repeat protein
VACIALWTVYAFVGPGVAAVHWDRYLRDVAAAGKLAEQRSALQTSSALNSLRDPLSQSIQKNLELAIAWDPSFARAHLRLAARNIEQFELAQQNASNAMNLGQIRDAAQQSTFATSEEKRRWLDRALGPNAQLLYQAYAHARAAVALSPLQGEAYIYLSELAFLHAEYPHNATAYLNQAIRVRPFDGDVEFEIGKQALLVGDMPSALGHWAHCYRSAGSHRARIVELLAGRIPANVFLETFAPDWHSLRQIWWRYRQTQNQDDCQLIATYATQLTERDVQRTDDIPPVYLWMWQAEIHQDLARPEQSLACLEAAYRCDQRVYAVRSRLGYALKNANRLAEAEAHLRWCAARHPEDKALGAAILEITRLRTTRAEPQGISSATLSRWQ